jgi:hypothetical protein
LRVSDTYFNFDFTTFASNSTNTVSEVCLHNSTAEIGCGAAGVAKGIVKLTGVTGQTDTVDLRVEVTTAQDFGLNNPIVSLPFVADVFSYGDGVNNAIYRLQLEESGDNTATFVGTIEYTMLKSN